MRRQSVTSDFQNEKAATATGPPGNEKPAGAANLDGLIPNNTDNLNARTVVTPTESDKGNFGYVSAEEAQRRLAELQELPPVPRHQSGLSSVGMVAHRIARRTEARRSREETLTRWRTRRTLAATYPVPPAMAAELTTSQMAFCRLIANDAKVNRTFQLSHKEVADRCRMHEKTAQRAQERLEELGWIKVETRIDPERPHRCLPNVIRIISKEWLAWIARGPVVRTPHLGHPMPSFESKDSKQESKRQFPRVARILRVSG